METSVTPEKKQSILKSLAIAGLLGIIVAIAWLAIQIVNVFPAALTSLVGVASSVYNYNPLETRSITLKEQSTLVNASEGFSVSWDTPRVSGTYTFLYPCIDGVSISLSTQEKTFSDLTCATEYDLGTTDSVTLFVNTSRERFTTLDYSIAFYRQNSTTKAAQTTASVTVVNTAIDSNATSSTASSTASTASTTAEVPNEVIVPKPETTESEVNVPTNTPKPVTKPAVTVTPQPTTPEYIYTYAIPVSKPDGTPDLSVSIAGLGFIDSNQKFIRTDTITKGKAGAIQFIVHNLGDKTSPTWSYEATLPGNTTYQSDRESALRPNERAIITVSYEAVTTSYLEKFSIVVTADGSERTLNNNIVGATEIVSY